MELMTQKEYLSKGASTCPIKECRSTDVQWGPLEMHTGNDIIQDGSCNQCGAKWYTSYKVDCYTMYDK